MDIFLVVLSVLLIIALNIWHTILLRMPTKGSKPQTISHHAVNSKRSLMTHRLMHSLTSVVLMAFGVFYLLPHGYNLAAVFIFAAALFDILEVLTLNTASASEITALNNHAITAWAMAGCYLLYMSAIVPIAGLPSYITLVVWSSFAVLLGIAITRKFRSFWITQHIYFCFLALVMVVSHLWLLV